MSFDTGNAAYRDPSTSQAPKQVAVAYILAIVFGVLGFHRVYLRKYKDAAIFFLGALMGTLLLIPEEPSFLRIIGFVAIGIVVLGWIMDLIRMPRLVAEANGAE
ncbi:TM2 domain-containing protein [uncultured Demequina sp.]|uniref:TM2 domain-containing protein n=1 Tax=uncultured Demequina sp. TaxID=693499 RepID=UPI0025F2621E|nr:TM2 domain-containing protein [uncultured Demequina sp.]